MDPQQLFLKDGKAILPCLCGKCGRIWESLDSAERCCKCSYCGEYCDWGRTVSHDACYKKVLHDSEMERLKKATLVSDYAGPFLWGDDVYMDVADFLESIDLEEIPDFGFCVRYQAPKLDLEDIIQSAADTMYPEWIPEEVPELEVSVARWNEMNEANGTYWEDWTRKWSKVLILGEKGSAEKSDA